MSLFMGGTGLGLPFNPSDLDNAFGAFTVLPGGTLVSQTVAKYPFANQSVAANATITEPLTISVIMDAPMRGPSPWAMKQAIMTALKATLDSHNNAGGTYTVMTPAYMYTNLIMTALTDNSRGGNSLPQNAWRFDFEKPLVTMSDAQGAYNQLMSKVAGGTPTPGDTTGPQVGLQGGQSPLSIGSGTAGAGGLTTASSLLAPGAVPSSVLPAGGMAPAVNLGTTIVPGSFSGVPLTGFAVS
jgi:hypothetical protein